MYLNSSQMINIFIANICQNLPPFQRQLQQQRVWPLQDRPFCQYNPPINATLRQMIEWQTTLVLCPAFLQRTMTMHNQNYTAQNGFDTDFETGLLFTSSSASSASSSSSPYSISFSSVSEIKIHKWHSELNLYKHRQAHHSIQIVVLPRSKDSKFDWRIIFTRVLGLTKKSKAKLYHIRIYM